MAGRGGGDVVARAIVSLPAPLRVLVVLCGAVLIHLSLGTYHTFGNMLPYMASYMRNHTDPTIVIEDLMWIPTLQGCFPFAMVIGGSLSNKLGPRFAAAIGCALMSSGVFLSSITIRRSLPLFVLTYGGLFGLGQGIAYVVAVATAINVGVVSGVVAAGFGISSSLFAPLQTKIVNPKNYATDSHGYFIEEDLLERVPPLFATLSGIYAFMQLLGLIVICDPPQSSALRHRSVSRSQSTDEEEEGDDVPLHASHHSDVRSMRPEEVLRSPTFYFLFAALFCCSFYANMFYNLYKTFAETFIKDDMLLAVAFSVASIANAVARILWGFFTDRTSFQMTLSAASCTAAILMATMPLTPSLGKHAFFFWLVSMFVCMAATHALFITAAVKCFGPRYKASNYGLLILSTTFSGVLLALMSEYGLERMGYSWMFIVTALFPFIAFLITSAIQKTPQGSLVTR